MRTMNVYIGRHGKSESNTTLIRDSGQSPLTELGMLQAEFSALRFKQRGIQKIVSSDFPRALATAEVHAAHLGLPISLVTPLLRERRAPSVMHGRHAQNEETQAIWRLIAEHYGDPGWKYSDEENFTDLLARAKEMLALFETFSEESIYAASHDLFMKVICAYVILGEHLNGRLFWDQFLPIKNIDHTGIMHLQFGPNYARTAMHWKLVAWNDRAHLESLTLHQLD